MLAEGTISWNSRKDSLIATSAMEVEFVACFEASNNALLLRNFIYSVKMAGNID